MRIAIWHNLVSGGGKRALNYHIKALKSKGHYIEIWTPDTSLSDTLHTVKDDVKLHILPLKDQLQKLKHPRFSFQQYQYINKRNEIIKRHCRVCAKEIHNGKFDVLFANSCSINYMSFMSLYASIPSVMYLGEPYRWNYEASPDLIWAAQGNKMSINFLKNHFSLIANRIQVSEEINAAKKYSKILVNSLFSRENVMRSYGIDSEVCYLGIDDSFFISPAAEKKPYVINVGLIYYLKGIDRVIKTIAKIHEHHRPKLVCIGNGADLNYRTQVEALAEKLNVELEISLNVNEEEMKKLVSEAAAMIYMPRLEPFGFAPLEANALGTTVVGIAEGGVRETVVNNKNGFLINNEDFETGALYIERLVKDMKYATECGKRSQAYAKENWSFKKLSDNIEASLQNVVNIYV